MKGRFNKLAVHLITTVWACSLLVLFLQGCANDVPHVIIQHDPTRNSQAASPGPAPGNEAASIELAVHPLNAAARKITTPTNSAFAEYDASLVRAVHSSWRLLVIELSLNLSQGTIEMAFHLHPNGRVTDMHAVGPVFDEKAMLICEKAILDVAPFAPWTEEMRRAITNDFREIRFTFRYE